MAVGQVAVLLLCAASLIMGQPGAGSTHAPPASELALQLRNKDAILEKLRCGKGLLGGYSPEDIGNEDLITYAALALNQYARNNTNDPMWQSCQPDPAATVRTIQIDAACKQVVAGTNYKFIFQVYLVCTAPGMNDIFDLLMATVYQPLPQSNGIPQVVQVNSLLHD